MKFLNPKIVKSTIEAANDGTTMNVAFVKQNGELRVMNCRRGVKKHLKGGKSTIAAQSNLIGVFDMTKQEYRCFDSTRVLSIKSHGTLIEA